MSIMTKMRENMAGIFAVFAFMFIIYIVFDWGMDYLGQQRNPTGDVIGEVNGRPIHINEFSELLQNLFEAQGREDVDDQLSMQLREQAWTMLVNQILLEQEIEKFGVKVTDQEIIDWVYGENPPEFLVRQFRDSAGTFNRAAYEAAIRDPQNRAVWVQIEKALRQQRAQEKFQSVLQAAVRVSEREVYDRFLEDNLKMNVEYVFFDAASLVKDSDVTITDDDIRKYYLENQAEFKRRATRKLKYVLFPEKPSSEDTAAVIQDLEEFARQARAGSNFEELVKAHSELPLTDAFFKRGELSPVRDSVVFSGKVGEIYGPIKDDDGYHLLKILEERRGKEVSIRASQILLHVPMGKDSIAAWAKARQLYQRAKRGEDFASLAREHSIDASAAKGGDLGWFGTGRMVKPFEDAAFKAKVGEVVGPVRSYLGLHIIKVTGRENREVKIADLFQPVRPSSQTKSKILERASDFSYLASEGDFDKEASLGNYQVQETLPFEEGTVIPGVGYNPEVSRFAFGNKLGAISEPIKTHNGYGVFKIVEAQSEGVRPLPEVKETIRSKVLLRKKIDKVGEYAKQMRNKLQPGDSLGVLAAYDTTLKVVKTGDFTPKTWLPNIGRDYGFVGKALSLNIGEISAPFAAPRGYYIMKLLSKTEPDSAQYLERKKEIRDQILQEKRSRYMSEWWNALRERADIVDNRR